MENYLTVQTHDGPMLVYMHSPDHLQRPPIMIVLQEAFGVNSYIKDICRRFAEKGYFAIAPELYHREGKHIQIDYSERTTPRSYMEELTNETILEDVSSILDFLQALPNVDTEEVYIIGFCMGGFSSMLCATELKVKGVISFYGAGMVRPREGLRFNPIVDEFYKINCSLLLFFGGGDASIPSRDVEEIRRSLVEHGKDFEILVLPNSDHGFFCHERKSYDREAAAFAWKKTLSWLRELRKAKLKEEDRQELGPPV